MSEAAGGAGGGGGGGGADTELKTKTPHVNVGNNTFQSDTSAGWRIQWPFQVPNISIEWLCYTSSWAPEIPVGENYGPIMLLGLKLSTFSGLVV